jgi:hypothetical protein
VLWAASTEGLTRRRDQGRGDGPRFDRCPSGGWAQGGGGKEQRYQGGEGQNCKDHSDARDSGLLVVDHMLGHGMCRGHAEAQTGRPGPRS